MALGKNLRTSAYTTTGGTPPSAHDVPIDITPDNPYAAISIGGKINGNPTISSCVDRSGRTWTSINSSGTGRGFEVWHPNFDGEITADIAAGGFYVRITFSQSQNISCMPREGEPTVSSTPANCIDTSGIHNNTAATSLNVPSTSTLTPNTARTFAFAAYAGTAGSDVGRAVGNGYALGSGGSTTAAWATKSSTSIVNQYAPWTWTNSSANNGGAVLVLKRRPPSPGSFFPFF